MMRKFLDWLQERIKHWAKPVASVLIIGIPLDLTRSRAALIVDQVIILKRHVKRPQLTIADRIHLVFLAPLLNFGNKPLYYSTRYSHALASESVSHVLAAEVIRQIKG